MQFADTLLLVSFSIDIKRRYDNLEGEWENICKHAEKNCSKSTKAKKYCFSPALDKAGRRVCYWKLRQSACRLGIEPPAGMKEERDALNIDDDGTQIETIVDSKLRAARKDLRESQAKAKELRKSFLEERAETMATAGNMSKEACYRSLIAAEQSRELYTSLRFIVDKNPSGAISRLQVPDPTDPNHNDAKKCKKWLDVEDTDEMNRRLIEKNKRQFRLAANTPFGDGSLRPMIRDPDVREAILQGTFDWSPHTDDEILVALMEMMQHDDDTRDAEPISLEVTTAQHIAKYRKMNENKSSSPSGLHRGHDLVHIQDDAIAAYRSEATMFPFQHGFSPAAWERMIECMLEKIPGKPHLGRLRQIALVETRYNTPLKILFNDRLMKQAEELNLFDGQIGGRKGYRAIEGVLLQGLTMDVYRHTLVNAIRFLYDAAACFDRMIPELTTLPLMKAGMPPSALDCNTQVLENARRQVRTAQGLSDPYQADEGEKLYGHGQGKGDAGAAWCILSEEVFRTLDQLTECQIVRSADKKVTVEQSATGFIDDTTGGVTSRWAEENDELDHLVRAAQRSAQVWVHLIYLTGGEVEWHKSVGDAVVWSFDDDGQPFQLSLEALGLENGLPFVNIATGEEAHIPFRSHNKAEEYLGVFTRPDGEQIDEFQDLLKISDLFAGIFRNNKLTKYQAKTLYEAIWFPMMQYSLAATQFTKTQCEELMKPVRQIAFARMGFNRNMPPEVMHGPRRFGGYGLRDIYTEQGIDGIEQLIGHLRAQDKIGELMEVLLSHVQLYSGYGTVSILENCQMPIEYLPRSWIAHQRQFLKEINGKISVPNAWRPYHRREHDSFIMEEVNQLKMSTANKRRVNDCRMYLGAITKSDLCTADGTEIDMKLLEGKERLTTRLIFPDRPSPPNRSWKIFRTTIRRLYAKHRKGKMPKRLRLAQPMGRWYRLRHHTWCKWTLDEEERLLYEYDKVKNCLNVLRYSSDQQGYAYTGATTTKFPKAAVPVQAVPSNVVKIVGHKDSVTPPWAKPSENETMSLRERIECQPEYVRRMIGNVQIPEDEFEPLAQSLAEGLAIIVSDGAVAKKRASHAWKIAVNSDNAQFAAAAGPCDADPDSITSYRAELTGIYGGLAFAAILMKHHGLRMPDDVKTTIYCDNESAVNTITMNEFVRGVKAHTAAEFDVIFELRYLLASTDMQIIAKHVKGHQDNDCTYDELPFPARINVDCDKLAGTFLRETPPDLDPRPSALMMSNVTLSIDDTVVTSNIPQRIRHKRHGEALKKYIVQKEKKYDPGWSEFDFDSVDWESFNVAVKKEKPGRVRRIIKFQHRWLPTGDRSFGPNATKSCPACRKPEDHEHLLRCESTIHKINAKLQIQILRRTLKSVHILPSIWAIIEGELQYTLGLVDEKLSPIFIEDAAGRHLRKAWVDQMNIGWTNMIKGRISPYWGLAQNECYRDRFPEKKTLSAQVFQIRLIRGMWQLFEGIWFQRNAILHHNDENANHDACNKKIREFYRNRRHLVDEHDLPLFRMFRKREYRDLPLATKERWLEQVQLAIKSKHGTLDVPSMKPLTDYFPIQNQ